MEKYHIHQGNSGCIDTSPNKRVSGFATLRPNPRLSARTSDTHWGLGVMPEPRMKKRIIKILGEKNGVYNNSRWAKFHQ